MGKKVVILDREDVESCIRRGGSSDGDYYVFVSADGTAWTGWRNPNDWPNPNAVARMKMPSLIEEGSGDYYLDLVNDWKRDAPRHPALWAEFQAAKQAADDDDRYFNGSEAAMWIEERDPEWVAAFEENAVDWLVSALEGALNGYGEELDDPDPWRDQEIDGRSVEEVFFFEIARRKPDAGAAGDDQEPAP